MKFLNDSAWFYLEKQTNTILRPKTLKFDKKYKKYSQNPKIYMKIQSVLGTPVEPPVESPVETHVEPPFKVLPVNTVPHHLCILPRICVPS